MFTLFLTPVKALSNTGTGNYGNDIPGYDIIAEDYVYTKGSRTWFGVGGTDKHEYLTYYLYANLRIRTIDLAGSKFKRMNNNRVTASYAEVLSLKKEYQMTTSVGWSIINNATISVSLTNYQSWEYRYSVGEEVTFKINNRQNEYVGVALVSVEIKIVERNVLREVYFGGAFGNVEQGSTTFAPKFKTYYFTVDYDFIPVFMSELSSSDRNKFELRNGEYAIKLTETYNPNFDYQYYESLPSGINSGYYIS